MLSHACQPRPHRRVLRPFPGRAAFTLIEVLVALVALGVMSGGAYIGFAAINTYAVSSRLYSEAQVVAQNHIDMVLSRGPFNITSTPNRVPVELMTVAELDALAATVPFPTTPPSGPPAQGTAYYPYYPYYRTSGGPLLKEGFIYTDPVSNKVVVRGTLQSDVTTISGSGGSPLSMTYAGVASNLNVRQARVKVTYSFRNHDYTVVLNTVRAADQ
jgi:prepilin-type N-terminal cleavage/methylation domain-containing protein